MVLGHTGEKHGPGDPRSEANQFYSRHVGGVHFLFGDGHVSFLNSSMDYATYLALSTRAGGEAISGSF
jgi:prepilin-type processing-associated H-X9-DG protein